MSYGVCHRCGSDPELLRLWLWLEVVALIQPLAYKLLYAEDAALKSKTTTTTTKLVYIKYIINMDLLYSTDKSTQYYVITYVGKELEVFIF